MSDPSPRVSLSLRAQIEQLIDKMRNGSIPSFTLSFDPLTMEDRDNYAIMRAEDVEWFLNRRADALAAILASLPADREPDEPAEGEIWRATDGRDLRVLGVRDDRGRVAVRNAQTNRLSYIPLAYFRGSHRFVSGGKWWLERASPEPAALASPQEPQEPHGWQPIATAPKGNKILGGAEHRVYGWLWDKASYVEFPELKKAEWIMWNGLSPTHWMPIPPLSPSPAAAPEQTKEKKP